MKFLVDQDVYAVTIAILNALGHEVVSATQLGLAQADDAELLRIAHEQSRIFVTRDRDFGAIVFPRRPRVIRSAMSNQPPVRPGRPHSGHGVAFSHPTNRPQRLRVSRLEAFRRVWLGRGVIHISPSVTLAPADQAAAFSHRGEVDAGDGLNRKRSSNSRGM